MSVDLTTTPSLFPIAMDVRADMILFVQLREQEYASASFLDRRMLAPCTQGVWKKWAEVRDQCQGLQRRCHFIFHISHVGSTLLSRLLGWHPELFSLREPAMLRKFVEANESFCGPEPIWDSRDFSVRFSLFLALYSRTFRASQTAVIKSTSFVSELAESMLERVPESKALMMYVSPKTFLRTLLVGAMSDIRENADRRFIRLCRRLDVELGASNELSPGESVAMSWLCELAAMSAAAMRFPSRVMWLDFDAFLNDTQNHLRNVFQHFNVASNEERVQQILSGPEMKRYSKAPEHAFDATKRSQLLRLAEQKHGTEIQKGLQWLARVSSVPVVRQILEPFVDELRDLPGQTGN